MEKLGLRGSAEGLSWEEHSRKWFGKVRIGVDKRAVERLTLNIEGVGWFDSGFVGSGVLAATLHAV